GDAGVNAAHMLQWRGIAESRMHGAYLLRDGMSAYDLYTMLSRNRQTPVRLTFNNLRTTDQLAARVASVLDINADEFRSAADSILADIPSPERIGHFMPDTYEFYWTVSPSRLVNTLTGYYDRFWNETRRNKAKALGLTPAQITTIASIAEEETNDPAERGTVGRLYINRLHRGMPLQADPTVKFAVGDFSLRRITNAHLSVKSPYNTYLNPGLPPGPIRMPSGATIDAILNAPANNYLYMCAKEDFSGKHNFTADYSTHLANARRYHQALNSRNIR
ncbi:MAG: endolytic transglycosylase MltG, partial [Muribaculum sp.]|nr:endolytic transglycosylase MltG [Muribaculum sp.]